MVPFTENEWKPTRKSVLSGVGGILLGYAGLMLLFGVISMSVVAAMVMAEAMMAGESVDPFTAIADPRVLGDGTGYIIAGIACVVMIRLWKKKGFLRRSLAPVRPMGLVSFVEIFLVFMGIQLVSHYMTVFTEGVLNHWGLSATAALETATGMGDDSVTMFLYACVLAPVVEELLFRGAIQKTLEPFGKKFGMVSSALLFGLFHGNVVQIPYAFLVGLVLSYVSAEYGMIWCILLHFLNNCVFSTLLGGWEPYITILMYVFFVGAIVVLARRGSWLRKYWKELPPNEPKVHREFFTRPTILILLVYCMVSAALTITPL